MSDIDQCIKDDVQKRNVANNVDRVKFDSTVTKWSVQKNTRHCTKHVKQ